MVFKTLPDGKQSLPTGSPPRAQMLADEAWHRTDVQTNIRRWLPHLGLRSEELQEAETQWAETFRALSRNGDPSTLRPQDQLVWHELPDAAPVRPFPVSQTSYAGDMVDNPPYNTISGAQSSSCMHARTQARRCMHAHMRETYVHITLCMP